MFAGFQVLRSCCLSSCTVSIRGTRYLPGTAKKVLLMSLGKVGEEMVRRNHPLSHCSGVSTGRYSFIGSAQIYSMLNPGPKSAFKTSVGLRTVSRWQSDDTGPVIEVMNDTSRPVNDCLRGVIIHDLTSPVEMDIWLDGILQNPDDIVYANKVYCVLVHKKGRMNDRNATPYVFNCYPIDLNICSKRTVDDKATYKKKRKTSSKVKIEERCRPRIDSIAKSVLFWYSLLCRMQIL